MSFKYKNYRNLVSLLFCFNIYTHNFFSFFFKFQSKWFSSVQFSRSVVSDSLQRHGLQHSSLPCLSSSPGVCPSSWSLNWRCHPTISSSVAPFSSCLQSFPASESFPMSWLFTSDGQNIGASVLASKLPKSIKG